MPKAYAVLRTVHASKYLQQLCKHFAHKLDVSFSESEGQIALPTGPSELVAVDGELRVSVEVDDDNLLPRAKNIIDKHLIKFAFREGFEGMNWSANPPANPDDL